jgi:hypothetical protein
MIGEVMEIITKVLQTERDNAREIVEAIVDAEVNYHFTNDQDFKENKSNIMVQD